MQLKCVFEWDKLDVKINNDPGCKDLYDQATGLIQDLNIYDLFRTQYGNGAGLKLTEAQRERSVIIDGMEKKYKLGYTPAEMNPFHKKPLKEEAQLILGDSMTSYLNRADVRAAFNIPSFV